MKFPNFLMKKKIIQKDNIISLKEKLEIETKKYEMQKEKYELLKEICRRASCTFTDRIKRR